MEVSLRQATEVRYNPLFVGLLLPAAVVWVAFACHGVKG